MSKADDNVEVAAVELKAPPPHTRPAADVVADLQSDPVRGLTAAEAAQRLATNGPNELRGSSGVNFWKILIKNILNAMNFVLAAAVALSAVAGDVVEGVVVAVIIVANTAISVAQEYRSEQTLDALRRMSSPVAHVLRDGEEIDVPAVQVVVGDIVILREGDQVPADVRMIESINLEVNEAMLTGESMAVRKDTAALDDPQMPLGDRRCMAFKNTVVTIGRGKGIVVLSGMDTEIGKIAQSIAASEGSTRTSLDRQMGITMFGLLGIACVLAVIVFAVNDFQVTTPVLLYALALTVAIIPEALPAVMTITFAVAIRQLAKEKAIVRRMTALEALGCVTNICSDKTGTLTVGRMTTTRYWTAASGTVNLENEAEFPEFSKVENVALRNMLLGSALCNTAAMVERDGELVGVGDATEVALLLAARKAGLDKEEAEKEEYLYETEMPFDAALKRMTTVVQARQADGTRHRFIVAKGAAEVVLERCTHWVNTDGAIAEMNETDKELVLKQTQDYADDALRVLAFAFRDDGAVTGPLSIDDRDALECRWTFAGVAGLQDPPRPESAPAVEQCKRAGIVVHMVTGDHPRTAAAIARRVGILENDTQVMVARDFDALTDEQIDALPELPRVIARCAPESKVRLIRALHRRNKVAAMTGDGVNDAPAVKHADVGIAMGQGGTDVTKQAADIVLTDDNFATIVRAVGEGRRIITNVAKFTLHLLSCNVSQVLLLVAGLGVVGTKGHAIFPMSALHILWMNLVTSSIPALFLGLDKTRGKIMERKPRSTREVVFGPEVMIDTFAYGVIMGAIVLIAFVIVIAVDPTGSFDAVGCNNDISPPGCLAVYRARSTTFTSLCIILLLHAYNCRDLRKSMFKINYMDNRGLTLVIVINCLLLIPLIYVPYVNEKLFHQTSISWEWGIIFAASIVFVLVAELYKWAKRALRRRFAGKFGIKPEAVPWDASTSADVLAVAENGRTDKAEITTNGQDS